MGKKTQAQSNLAQLGPIFVAIPGHLPDSANPRALGHAHIAPLTSPFGGGWDTAIGRRRLAGKATAEVEGQAEARLQRQLRYGGR